MIGLTEGGASRKLKSLTLDRLRTSPSRNELMVLFNVKLSGPADHFYLQF